MTEQGGDVRVRVAGILITGDSILLIAHKKNDDVYWLLPGGGVDYGESLSEALIREFVEELNIDITVNDLALISDSIDPAGDRHIVNICFICKHEGGEYILGDEGRLHDFRFFKKDEIPHINLFPPINNELVSIMNSGVSGKYIGKLWKEQ
ncbi:MAG TPA: NUDIX hydrolase [Spirochaetota bacterium]|nr:NUDIX hydrolase [Spirochaetota bacterium]HPS86031.1 NUDIX hydrolase [Spirochaetota bacterium]